jgi:hypothetical protein
MKRLQFYLLTIFSTTIISGISDGQISVSHQLSTENEAEVGTLPGAFAFSSTGAATYTIPIDLPEGRAGLTPQLAFVYNSQVGNNVMGPGWNITGFSSISRMNPTLYYNNEIDNIESTPKSLTLIR